MRERIPVNAIQIKKNSIKKEFSQIKSRIINAFYYPLQSNETFTIILLGGFLWWFGSVYIPRIFVLGYMTRVMRSGMETEPKEQENKVPPDFNRWAELFSTGTKILVIWITYLVLPWPVLTNDAIRNVNVTFEVLGLVFPDPRYFLLTILQQIGIPIHSLENALNYNIPRTNQNITQTVGESFQIYFLRIVRGIGNPLPFPIFNTNNIATVDLAILYLIVIYVMPAVIGMFSLDKRLSGGFEFGTLRSILLDWRYLLNWLVAFTILAVSYSPLILLKPIFNLPYGPGLYGTFVYFYCFIVAFYIMGNTLGEIIPISMDKRVERLEKQIDQLSNNNWE
jgi:hypothetical protein